MVNQEWLLKLKQAEENRFPFILKVTNPLSDSEKLKLLEFDEGLVFHVLEHINEVVKHEIEKSGLSILPYSVYTSFFMFASQL